MKYKITAYLLFSFLLSSHAFCQYDHTKLDELFEHSDFAGKDGYVVAVFKNDISI